MDNTCPVNPNPETPWRLFLDDERFPVKPNCLIARSSMEAIQMLQFYGLPRHIDFDHDLGFLSTGIEDRGIEVVNFLWRLCEDGLLIFPRTFTYAVHSQNPEGAKNIRSKMDQLLKYYQED